MTGRYHTAADLAQMFNKTATFVKRRANAGDWPGFKVGQEWRFTDDDVAAITQIGRRPAASESTAVLTRSTRRRRKAAS